MVGPRSTVTWELLGRVGGWVGAVQDTGLFPIPDGFRVLLGTTKLEGQFYDLCWDAMCVLRDNMHLITAHWQAILDAQNLDDHFLREQYIAEVGDRLARFERKQVRQPLT